MLIAIQGVLTWTCSRLSRCDTAIPLTSRLKSSPLEDPLRDYGRVGCAPGQAEATGRERLPYIWEISVC